MYCMHCGNQIADNSRYCRYCGKLVAEDEIRTVNDYEQNAATCESAEPAKEAPVPVEAEQDTADAETAINQEEGVAAEAAINKDKTVTEDDIFFEHISKGKKAALFFVAVVLTVIVAVIVFTTLYPGLV